MWGLRTAGVSFAIAVAVLAIMCLVAIVVRANDAAGWRPTFECFYSDIRAPGSAPRFAA